MGVKSRTTSYNQIPSGKEGELLPEEKEVMAVEKKKKSMTLSVAFEFLPKRKRSFHLWYVLLSLIKTKSFYF